MTGIGIISTEHLRAGLNGLDTANLPDPDGDEHHAAAVTLGLHPVPEHDGTPHCDWCGRSNPPGGLTDISEGGPGTHACADGDDCASARAQRDPMWLDKQYKAWRVDWAKYAESLQAAQRLAARRRYGGGIYELTAEEADPAFLLALAEVRAAAEPRALELAREWLAARPSRYYSEWEQEQALELTAHGEEASAPPPAPVPAGCARLCYDRDCSHMTLRCPDQRTHTLGHHLQHKHVTDAVSAVAHRNVRARR